MAQVNVTINGKTFRMACDDGQEEHLYGLARRLDATIDELRGVFGEIGDLRLTVMSAITVLDRLAEAERRTAALEAEVADLKTSREAQAGLRSEAEVAIAERIAGVADRIEALAEQLNASVRNGQEQAR